MARSVLRALAERIEPDADTGCWRWTGAKNGRYGYFWFLGKMMPAHRVVYRVLIGPIPDGLTLDHLCSNPPCVYPRHLEPVTHMENCQRGRQTRHPVVRAAANRRCKYGHWMSAENTYNDSRGRSRCRPCHAVRMRFARKSAGAKKVEREVAA